MVGNAPVSPTSVASLEKNDNDNNEEKDTKDTTTTTEEYRKQVSQYRQDVRNNNNDNTNNNTNSVVDNNKQNFMRRARLRRARRLVGDARGKQILKYHRNNNNNNNNKVSNNNKIVKEEEQPDKKGNDSVPAVGVAASTSNERKDDDDTPFDENTTTTTSTTPSTRKKESSVSNTDKVEELKDDNDARFAATTDDVVCHVTGDDDMAARFAAAAEAAIKKVEEEEAAVKAAKKEVKTSKVLVKDIPIQPEESSEPIKQNDIVVEEAVVENTSGNLTVELDEVKKNLVDVDDFHLDQSETDGENMSPTNMGENSEIEESLKRLTMRLNKAEREKEDYHMALDICEDDEVEEQQNENLSTNNDVIVEEKESTSTGNSKSIFASTSEIVNDVGIGLYGMVSDPFMQNGKLQEITENSKNKDETDVDADIVGDMDSDLSVNKTAEQQEKLQQNENNADTSVLKCVENRTVDTDKEDNDDKEATEGSSQDGEYDAEDESECTVEESSFSDSFSGTSDSDYSLDAETLNQLDQKRCCRLCGDTATNKKCCSACGMKYCQKCCPKAFEVSEGCAGCNSPIPGYVLAPPGEKGCCRLCGVLDFNKKACTSCRYKFCKDCTSHAFVDGGCVGCKAPIPGYVPDSFLNNLPPMEKGCCRLCQKPESNKKACPSCGFKFCQECSPHALVDDGCVGCLPSEDEEDVFDEAEDEL